MRPAPLLALAALLALAGCNVHVEGNGVYAQVDRTGAPFDGVDVGLGLQVTVLAGTGTRKVLLSGDENVLQYIDVTVGSDGKLHTSLKLTHSVESFNPLKLVIWAPELVSVRAAEAAKVAVTGAANATPGFAFSVVQEGASTVSLAGPGSDALDARLAGASVLEAAGYPVLGASAALTGASHASFLSSGPVTGSASGASQVEVHGTGTCALTLADASTCTPVAP